MVEWMELTDYYTDRKIKVKPITVVKMQEAEMFSTKLTIVYADVSEIIRVNESINQVEKLMYYKPFWSWRK